MARYTEFVSGLKTLWKTQRLFLVNGNYIRIVGDKEWEESKW
jgi:hypothetical protein